MPEARFDPADDDAIATAIERALTDDATRALLDEQARRPLPDWDAVADRVAGAYERLLARPRPPARRRPLVAVVTPLPPAASGVADYSYRLARRAARALRRARVRRRTPPRRSAARTAARARRCRGAPGAAPRRSRTGPRRLRLRRLLPRQQRVSTPARWRSSGGARAIVLAHEVRLTDLYALSRRRARRGARRLRGVPRGDVRRAAARTGASGRLPPDEAERLRRADGRRGGRRSPIASS